MQRQITVAGRETVFPCGESETVLDAAERAGWGLPYSCRKGVCSSCEARVVSGEVACGPGARRENGPLDAVKLCQAVPLTDIEIDPVYITDRTPPARRRMQAHVFRIDTPSADVRIVHLRFPIGRRVPFQAGQYVKLLLDDDLSRNYSLANPPRDNDAVQLHVQRLPGGYFSDRVLGGLNVGDALELEMPFGLFTLSDSDDARTILLATGTGFAPIRSILQDLVRRRVNRRVWLYWGARTRDEIYQFEQMQALDQRYDWFSFVPVLSRQSQAPACRQGYVQSAVLEDHPDLADYEVYACGSQTMVQAAHDRLIEDGGLDEANFYSDVFVPATTE
ncbi:2Fe-2S iron-sulfur cluster-binding protein [Salinisphaera orenii]|uniref:Ferredoxin n=1 Tax=Salinisphaera orenii YIM 95161 TaxID=1051139 RepID=A0A423PTQ5_9GAMM|nr:2Fe-2S iron-sulfur cluster-binding protein [Salinisphaera halophila]ROO28973.1 ferredoxin [Salinisphaera halophila YIM 95161]